MISKLICYFKGHKRGKLIRALDNGRVKFFACPRCSRETSLQGKDMNHRERWSPRLISAVSFSSVVRHAPGPELFREQE